MGAGGGREGGGRGAGGGREGGGRGVCVGGREGGGDVGKVEVRVRWRCGEGGGMRESLGLDKQAG